VIYIPNRLSHSVYIVVGLVFVCLLLTTQPLLAQESSITITGVNIDNLPEVSVSLAYENLQEEIDTERLSLQEDSVPQEIVSVSAGEAQIAFLFVMSSQTSYKEPTQSAILRLLGGEVKGVIPDEIGKIAFFAPDAGGSLKRMADWSNDNNATFRQFRDSSLEGPPTNEVNVPQLVLDTIGQFDQSQAGKKTLYVFSDGTGPTNPETIQRIRTSSKGVITIHTILLQTANGGNPEALSNIAAAGSGRQYNFNFEDPPETLDTLWVDTLTTGGTLVATYQSTNSDPPSKIQVGLSNAGTALNTEITVADDSIITDTTTPSGALLITILNPPEGSEYTLLRSSEIPRTPDSDCPRRIDVSIAAQTPENGSPPTLQAATYQLSGLGYTIEPISSSATSAIFCLSDLRFQPGNHYLEVSAIDNLGRTSQEEEVVLDIKPAPPTLVEQILANLALLISMLTAFAALGVALYLLRNRTIIRPVTEIIEGGITTIKTVIYKPRASMSGASVDPSQAPARLIRTTDQSHLPSDIPLVKENTSIGRDRTFSDIAIKDKHISRIHCRINNKDNTFTILDEGSSSGVYLNDSQERIPMMGQVLNNGDIIHLGPIQYRFEVLSASPELITTAQGTEIWSKDRQAPAPEPWRAASAKTEKMAPGLNYDSGQAEAKTVKETVPQRTKEQKRDEALVDDASSFKTQVYDNTSEDASKMKTERYDDNQHRGV